jgi:tRNA(Ile)-lysidine synthase
MLALIVDHGLRVGSAAEAALTQEQLVARGIEARVLTISGLSSGSGLQELARAARFQMLAGAARASAALFLLLGHHSADQAETVAMRAVRGSAGLEGMAGWTARDDLLLLRPLLGVEPGRLRAFLRAEGMAWIEDPSNADSRFERVRVRLAGTGWAPENPAARREREIEAADFIGRHVALRREGFAVVDADIAPAPALAALIRIIGGAGYPPRQDAVAALAAGLRPATLAGVRVLQAGKLGPGWLLVREPAACAPPIPAVAGAVWDGRFRLMEGLEGAEFGALGQDAVKFRKVSGLPSVVLRGLACVRRDDEVRLAAVLFTPPGPAAAHPFQA